MKFWPKVFMGQEYKIGNKNIKVLLNQDTKRKVIAIFNSLPFSVNSVHYFSLEDTKAVFFIQGNFNFWYISRPVLFLFCLLLFLNCAPTKQA